MLRAIRLVSFCALLSAAGGCGLVLDLDPEDRMDDLDAGGDVDAAARDAGSDGSVVPTDDAGAIDAATTDAGDASTTLDADVPSDAGDVDAGDVDGGGPVACRTSSDCDPSQLCQRAPGQCLGDGSCVAPPTSCVDVDAPVCGCDWEVYENSCGAYSRGANVMQSGACPIIRLETEWCSLVPMGADHPGGCRRCFDHGDCSGLLPICVASSCHPGGEGLCALGGLPADVCYDARHCRATEMCMGAGLDVCPARQGRCVPR